MQWSKYKWLAYNSSITENIFDVLIEIIESYGYHKYSDNQNDFDGFKKLGALRFTNNAWMTGCMSLTDDEYTVKQILSYKIPASKEFPYQIGDVLRCDYITIWSSANSPNCPLYDCIGEEITISKIGEAKGTINQYINFAGIYKGVEYGFCYGRDNKYTLIKLGSTFSPTYKIINPILIIVPKL